MTNEFITIKGKSKDTLEITLSGGAPYNKIKESLTDKLDKSRSFFEGSNPKVVITGGRLKKAQAEEIKSILLSKYALKNVAYVESSAEKSDKAAAKTGQAKEAENKGANRIELISNTSFNARSIFVTHTVRSGQRIECEGDIVVLGDVNPGAELIAGGSIAVMGALRGLAHAGATGRKDVAIAAIKLKPVQLRISSKAALFPENSETPYPELAELIDGNIVIRPIASRKK